MYSELSKGEQRAARHLIKAALELGYSISVNNGDEWSPRFSAFHDVWDEIGETETDNLLFFNAEGNKVGWMLLVWGNDPDGSELITDHTSNTAMDNLINAARSRQSGE